MAPPVVAAWPSSSAKAEKTQRKTRTLPSTVRSCFLHRTLLLRFDNSLTGLKRKAVIMAEKEPSSGMDDGSRQPTSSSSTPDLWMLKWLQIHRRSFLRHMQNVTPMILDYLVEKGKIHPFESDVYQEIMLDTTAPLQKARKLLDWLGTQPPDVFWTFQHAIRQDCLQTEAVHRLAVSDKEMRDLMERVKNMSLPERLDLMSCRGVLKAREQLQKTYRSRDEMLMSAGLAKGKTMTMDKILVNVCLLSSEEAKKAFEKPSFSSQQDRERCEYLFSKVLQASPQFSVWKKCSKQSNKVRRIRTRSWLREVQDAANRCASLAKHRMTGPLESCGSSLRSCFVLSFETRACGRQKHSQSC